MALPLLAIALMSFGGGAVAGAVSRQPEINRLRKQVKLLQDEIVTLRNAMNEQQRQISELKLRFQTLKAINFVEKRKVRGVTRGFLIFQYGFREYIELLLKQHKGRELQGEEARFFQAFNLIVSDQEISDEDKLFIRDHVVRLYGRQIDSLTPLSANDEDELVQKVEAA